MFQKKITITHPKGIHLTPASHIVKICLRHPSLKVSLTKDETKNKADAISVMSILSLELSPGSIVVIEMSEKNEQILAELEKILSG